jgi:hypothetical protein
VQINEGEHRCSYCGALVDVPPHSKVSVRIEELVGKFVVRTLVFDEKEIHSCEINTAEH